MSTPATIAIILVSLSLCYHATLFIIKTRAYLAWLKRDMAMREAANNYLSLGEIEEAREIRQHCRREFEKMFN